MTPLNVLDEKAGDIIDGFLQENEIALVIRTNGNDVRVIAPDYKRPYLAKMLRIAASMLEQPKDRAIN